MGTNTRDTHGWDCAVIGSDEWMCYDESWVIVKGGNGE